MARVRAAKGTQKKIETYVAALVEIQPRLAPVYLALRDAAASRRAGDQAPQVQFPGASPVSSDRVKRATPAARSQPGPGAGMLRGWCVGGHMDGNA